MIFFYLFVSFLCLLIAKQVVPKEELAKDLEVYLLMSLAWPLVLLAVTLLDGDEDEW